MPVEAFSGKLDAPKVEAFTGKLDAIAPGSPQAAQMSHPYQYADVGGAHQLVPMQGDMSPARKAFEDQSLTDYQAEQIKRQTGNDIRGPVFDRPETQRAMRTPALVTAGTLATLPIGGWGGLVAQSGMAGAMTTLGEGINQKEETGSVNVPDVLKQGAYAAGGNFAAGSLLKGLGSLAKKSFYTPLDEGQQQAAQFARDKGLKFPLNSAAPGSGASNVQNVSRGAILGDIKNYTDAKQVTAYLNRAINNADVNLPEVMNGTITPTAEAAKKGQQFLRSVFEPGEKAYGNAFTSYYDAVGGQGAIIPTGNTLTAVNGAVQTLEARGAVGPVIDRLKKIQTGGAQSLTAKEMNELHGSLIKEMGKNREATAEAGQVMRGIITDMDVAGKPFGASFSDMIGQAEKIRSGYRSLKDIPRLESLSKEFGARGGAKGDLDWMSKMFADPDGRALSEIRKANPDLYHELADSWLANNLKRFAEKGDPEGLFRSSLDGGKLRNWYVTNKDKIKLIYGAPQAKALDNFTSYASYMDAASRAGNKLPRSLDVLSVGARLGGAGAAKFIGVGAPLIIGSEGGAYVLAKGLSDPNSALFKLFTEGVSDKTRSLWLATGQMGGAAGGKAFADAE